MRSFPASLVRRLSTLALITFALLFALLKWADDRDKQAENKARNICADIQPGSNSDNLRALAHASGADDRHSQWRHDKENKQDVLSITYIGVPPFSRFYCLVRAQNGRVMTTELGHLD